MQAPWMAIESPTCTRLKSSPAASTVSRSPACWSSLLMGVVLTISPTARTIPVNIVKYRVQPVVTTESIGLASALHCAGPAQHQDRLFVYELNLSAMLGSTEWAAARPQPAARATNMQVPHRSEEHTSELQ